MAHLLESPWPGPPPPWSIVDWHKCALVGQVEPCRPTSCQTKEALPHTWGLVAPCPLVGTYCYHNSIKMSSVVLDKRWILQLGRRPNQSHDRLVGLIFPDPFPHTLPSRCHWLRLVGRYVVCRTRAWPLKAINTRCRGTCCPCHPRAWQLKAINTHCWRCLAGCS